MNQSYRAYINPNHWAANGARDELHPDSQAWPCRGDAETKGRSTADAVGRRLPGSAGGYPTGPPTDPDVPDSGIRFLGSQSLSTTLTQNLTALQTPSDGVDDSGCWQRKPVVQPVELLPGDSALMAATTQPVPPCLRRILAERVEPPVVAPDAIVLVVAA